MLHSPSLQKSPVCRELHRRTIATVEFPNLATSGSSNTKERSVPFENRGAIRRKSKRGAGERTSSSSSSLRYLCLERRGKGKLMQECKEIRQEETSKGGGGGGGRIQNSAHSSKLMPTKRQLDRTLSSGTCNQIATHQYFWFLCSQWRLENTWHELLRYFLEKTTIHDHFFSGLADAVISNAS